MTPKTKYIAAAVGLALLASAAYAATNRVSISDSGNQRCITSNGIPNHTTGQFPNKGNPHTMKSQNVSFCVTKSPTKGNTAQQVAVPGIALNGVIMRPGTADWYDASSPRGHSRDRSSGWNLDGMGARDMLGLDDQNAHVGRNGEYHYHGVPKSIASITNGTLMGYAADGFEIHYVGSSAKASYMLLPGSRSSSPGGAHDGTYNEDWQYVQGSGNLDKCNGGIVDGKYVYFATDTYPFYPRCLYGTDVTRFR